MDDGVIKGTGNSRYLKTVSDALTRWPTWQDALAEMVAGTFPFDLNGINAAGWTKIGTMYNKANVLTDATSALLGGAQTVNEALAKLSPALEYNQYTWKARKIALTPTETVETINLFRLPNTTITGNKAYYNEANADENGNIVVSEPIVVTASYSDYTRADVFNGKYVDKDNVYFATGSEDIYKCESNASRASSGGYYYITITARRYTTRGDWYYLTSKNRNTYPDSGILNGVEYQFLGVPFENARDTLKLASGVYIGNGAKNRKIDVPFTPKMVYVGYDTGGITVSGGCFGGLVFPDLPAIHETQYIVGIVENGFQVSHNDKLYNYYNTANFPDYTFRWFAFS